MNHLFRKLKDLRDQRRNKIARKQIRAAGFWFVDVPRTGSTSMKIQLGDHVSGGFGKSGGRVKKIVDQPFFQDHTSGREVAHALGEEIWNEIYTFSIVRNPWARFYSMYKYRMATDLKTASISFPEYIRTLDNLEAWNRASPYWMNIFYWPMAAYLCDGQGNLIVDDVFKFEEYNKAVEAVSNRLKIELDGGMVENSLTGNTNYREHYTPEMRDVIARLYRKDIELFDYSF
jgi:hypothetical protein